MGADALDPLVPAGLAALARTNPLSLDADPAVPAAPAVALADALRWMQPSTVIELPDDERALGCWAAPLGVCGVSAGGVRGCCGAADGGEDGFGDGVCCGACAASDAQSSAAREPARNILLMLASSSRDGTNTDPASKLNATTTSAFRAR